VYFMTWTFLGFGSTDTSIGGDNTEDFRSFYVPYVSAFHPCRLTSLMGQCHEIFFHESSSRHR
jgi:hypothetical protein